MTDAMESTLAAAARMAGGAADAPVADPWALAAALTSPKPAVLVATVGLPDSAAGVPEGWIVLCPADAVETEKVLRLGEGLASRHGRRVLVAVSDVPAPRVTAPSDVIDVGWPNVYRTGGDVTLVSTGPALHIACEAARQMEEAGLAVGVMQLPALRPHAAAGLAEIVRSARALVFIAGHPLASASGLPAALADAAAAAGTAFTLAARPTVPAIVAAAGELVSSGLARSSQGDAMIGRPRFSQRIGRLGTENAFEVLAEVNRLRAQGRDIISFAIGEPDFPSPSNVKRAGMRAIEEDKTHYSESAGIPPLRQAIADYICRTRGVAVGPENVVVTPGAKPIMFNTMASVVDPGDEVIYPNPGFPIYESLIDFLGARSVPLPLREELGFNFDPDELRRLVTSKTRLVILNTPQNPTGGVLSEESLRVVADVAQERGLWVLADEVYSQMVYDGAFASVAALPGMLERTIILDGFSKTYAMTGWRLGFGVMPAALALLEARLETNLNSCTATFTQWAGAEALAGDQSESRAMIAEFARRRKLIVDRLNAIPGFSCQLPGGAFYVFPNVTEACRMVGAADSKEFQTRLLHEANVAVLPRSAFGRRPKDERGEYVRFSYASSTEMIEKGLARIREFMEKAR